MSKNTRWTPEDMRKAGLVEHNGSFKPVSGLVDKKPVKLPKDALHTIKPIIKEIPGMSAEEILKAYRNAGIHFINEPVSIEGFANIDINLTVDRRDMQAVAIEYLSNKNIKATKKAIMEAIKEIRIQEADDFLMRQVNGNTFYVKGEVKSTKNHKQILKRKDGTRFIGKAFATMRQEKITLWEYKSMAAEFMRATEDLPLPLFLKFTFIMATDVPFDFQNMAQGPLDQMQKYGCIRNDNRHCVVPIYNPITYISPAHAGVVIEIL